MNRWIKQKSLQKDGYKLVVCRNCLRVIGKTYIGEKNIRKMKCQSCKNIQVVTPPRLGTLKGKNGAFWCEQSDSCFTAFAE